MPQPELGDEPEESLLAGAYNQTYVIRAIPCDDPHDDPSRRRVLFKCGNWCYSGSVEFTDPVESLASIPYLIPDLQRQQNKLGFFCSANTMPEESEYYDPLAFVSDAAAFVAQELASDRIGEELAKWSQVFPWMDSDDNKPSKAYFELSIDPPPCMQDIAAVASKTYTRGLVLIMIYYAGTFYVVMEDGEGDQPLLDIRFPDISQHGQGLHLSSYPDQSEPWRKLTLWQSIAKDPAVSPTKGSAFSREAIVGDLSSGNYVQAYVVLKNESRFSGPHGSGGADPLRKVMFRFGSWCYSGKVNLAPNISLVDIPHVIPILRMQQNMLEFSCDVTSMPRRSPFFPPMERIMNLAPVMEREILESEGVLANLIKRLSIVGLGETISEWLEGESTQSFFEFQEANASSSSTSASALGNASAADDPFSKVEVVAAKVYHPSGVVTVMVWFRGTFYVAIADGQTEQPLLDSRFPDVSEKGRGYQLRAYPEGTDGWPALRKVSIWQTGKALKSQLDKAKGKLEELRAAKGDDAVEAAVAEQKKLEELYNEALRGSPSIEAQIKATPATRVVSQKTGAKGEGKTTGAGAISGEDTPTRPSLNVIGSNRNMAGNLANDASRISDESDEKDSSAAAAADGDVVVKRAGYQAAKSLTGSRVALPHHIAPLQADSALQSKLRQLQGELAPLGGAEGVKAPWDARGRPLGGPRAEMKGDDDDDDRGAKK